MGFPPVLIMQVFLGVKMWRDNRFVLFSSIGRRCLEKSSGFWSGAYKGGKLYDTVDGNPSSPYGKVDGVRKARITWEVAQCT